MNKKEAKRQGLLSYGPPPALKKISLRAENTGKREKEGREPQFAKDGWASFYQTEPSSISMDQE
jgi:hypothetical protein